MIPIWKINLYQKKKGKFKIEIVYANSKKTVGVGRTAHLAYEDALSKMIFKPWLVSYEGGIAPGKGD